MSGAQKKEQILVSGIFKGKIRGCGMILPIYKASCINKNSGIIKSLQFLSMGSTGTPGILEKWLSKWEIHSTAPNIQQTPTNQLAQGFPQHSTLQQAMSILWYLLLLRWLQPGPTQEKEINNQKQIQQQNPTNFQEDLEAFHNF
jgi:hypothetical protein